jgi:hypothetical protein
MRIPRVFPALLEITLRVDRWIMLAGKKSRVEVPGE